jgi:hypothetical protein
VVKGGDDDDGLRLMTVKKIRPFSSGCGPGKNDVVDTFVNTQKCLRIMILYNLRDVTFDLKNDLEL